MAERLAPGVHLLELGWHEPFGANAYLIDDGSLTLIDSGFPVAGQLEAELADASATVADIDRVLITHYDLDHIGGLARVARNADAPVFIGAADLDIITGATAPPVFHHKGLFHRGLRAVFRLPDSLTFHPVTDGDIIGEFAAIHTPGHNPGHTVYVHRGRRAALLGDLVWESNGRLTLPIRLDSYDMTELRASVRRLSAITPPFEVACVGHGDPILTGGADALTALADRIEGEAPGLLR